MKRTFYSVLVIVVFIFSGIVTSLAQPSQLAKAINIRKNYIPIEIQDGFVLDSVFYPYSSVSSGLFNSYHFKYNSSGQLIWEDDLGAVVVTSIGPKGRPINKYYQTFSDNSYNEKGLLALQNVHYVDTVLRNIGGRTYSYDNNNRIVSFVNFAENGDTNSYTKYQYNSSGNLTLYYVNQIYGSISSDSLIMEYDSLGRIKSRLDIYNGKGYFYKYDSIGNATCTISDVINQSIIDTLQVHRFEYDGSGRKLLDILSYRTEDTLTYNNKAVFTYDGSGKILSIVDTEHSYGTWCEHNPYIFSYNSDNNLDSCVTGWSESSDSFKPAGILLYDHYGNAFYCWFESSIIGGFKVFPYYSKLSSMGVTNSKITPSDFYLNQNYPNPFNPSTEISYTLASAGNVTLKVYNMLGQEVATLVKGYQAANTYKVNFNASNLSSGVYFYKLRAGSNVVTRKMILMK